MFRASGGDDDFSDPICGAGVCGGERVRGVQRGGNAAGLGAAVGAFGASERDRGRGIGVYGGVAEEV